MRAFRLMEPVATFLSRLPNLALDRMACSHDLELTAVVVPRAKGMQALDHLPLLADLRWLG